MGKFFLVLTLVMVSIVVGCDMTYVFDPASVATSINNKKNENVQESTFEWEEGVLPEDCEEFFENLKEDAEDLAARIDNSLSTIKDLNEDIKNLKGEIEGLEREINRDPLN